MKFPILIEGWFPNDPKRVRLINSVDEFPLKQRFQIIMEDANADHLKALEHFLAANEDDDIPF